MHNLCCKNKFYLHENKKVIFISKPLQLASLRNRGLGQLGNGLLARTLADFFFFSTHAQEGVKIQRQKDQVLFTSVPRNSTLKTNKPWADGTLILPLSLQQSDPFYGYLRY